MVTIKNIFKRVYMLTPIGKRRHSARINNGTLSMLLKCKNEALNMFSVEKPKNGSVTDYLDAWRKYGVSYSEYMYQYEFWRLSEAQREEFVSRMHMISFYRQFIPSHIKRFFRNKAIFLKTFSLYVRRIWRLNISLEDFNILHSNYDLIVKPIDGNCGQGVFKITKGDNSRDWYSVIAKNMLIEQCIEGCDELQRFHPQSLNTIRVVTVVQGGVPKVFHSFLRTGSGSSIVDNAHAGGLFSQVNIVTGILESDAIDVNGNKYKKHPDSGITFIGYQLPMWQEIVRTCENAARTIKDVFIVGWDVTVLKDGTVELIEGNHGPDFDVMQSPLKVGIRKKIFKAIFDYYGNIHLELPNN